MLTAGHLGYGRHDPAEALPLYWMFSQRICRPGHSGGREAAPT